MVQDESNDGRTTVERERGILGFRVLGPLEVVRPTGEVVGVRRAKPARLLAVLLIHAGQPVAVDALVDAIWPEAPPESAAKTLQTYVGQVRSVLEPDREPGDTGAVLHTERTAYRLAVAPTAIDAGRFVYLTRRATEVLHDDPATAEELLDEALGLWRGPPYSDFGYESFAQPEIRRLEELRLTALEGRLDARLALGRRAAVVAQLQELVRRHPLREHLWAQLMRALYLSGRQADALHAFTSARDALATELGVDPGPELTQVHRQILAHDLPEPHHTTAASPAPPSPAPLPLQHRWVTVMRADREHSGHRVARDGFASTVQRYGGTLTATDPAGALVVFGTPVTHDDDAERAVRCAFALRRWANSTGSPLRIGIASGEVEIAFDDTATPSAQGQPACAARSLARLAAPGQALVGEATMRSTGHAVRYEAQPRTDAWLAVDVVDERVGRPLSATPFVGRATELDVLDGVWELTLRASRPHLVTVVGTAGVGKSRLMGELSRRLGQRGVRVLTGRSYPFGDAVFGAFAQVVTQMSGLSEAGSDRSRRSRIDEWLTGFLPPEERGRQPEYLVTLLSVLGDFADLRQTTIESLRHLVELAAARQPTAIIFDDVHRAHPDLVNLVESLAGRARGVPLLIVVATRPQLLGARPAWGTGRPAATTLPLDALPPADARELASAVSDDAGGSEAFDAAGGNPLFIEELARWRAGGRAGREPVPPTVRSVVMARLDTLPAIERQALVDASVVGHRFWAGTLGALAGGSTDDTDAALDALELKELIVRQPGSILPGQRAFAFHHELFADVAYSTVPDPLRADKHLTIARWLDDVGQAVPPALLAHHWSNAGDPDRAIDQLVAAGDAANQGWSRDRAVSLYQQAIDIIGDTDPERARRINNKRAVALQAWAHIVLDVGHLRMDTGGTAMPLRWDAARATPADPGPAQR